MIGRKGNFNSPYFRKGDMANNLRKLGNFHRPGHVYPMVKAGDFDLKEAVRAGNALERKK